MGAGNEWIVDADLKDYFGSVDHEKFMTLVGKQVADGRVLNLVQQMLKASYEEKGQRYETPRGTPQGGVVSPLLSNILLTPFDKEMRQKGYRLTRWADDWVVTCRTQAAEAENALAQATKILDKLGVTLNREKTRIVHISKGFEFGAVSRHHPHVLPKAHRPVWQSSSIEPLPPGRRSASGDVQIVVR
jgi:RNA-directed DNA polymerase